MTVSAPGASAAWVKGGKPIRSADRVNHDACLNCLLIFSIPPTIGCIRLVKRWEVSNANVTEMSLKYEIYIRGG
jgi:hypothetical protein